ncbi:MAG: ORF6C domain-containing protein [Zoogloeaceae bacterium]|jgi:prophage antirepressor-like protein|nr:ORF6C domain-containing protein [Zoogloeaceae bacterium]
MTHAQSLGASAPAIFNFDSHAVRIVTRDDQPWFVASDIADALEYLSAKDIARILDDDERGRHIVPTPSGEQEMTIISESGLYHAILKSRKPKARPFRKWVTGEVLPAIRKTGRYESPTIEKTPDEGRLYQAVCAKTSGDGNARHWLWGKLNAHFNLASYKNLPAARFEEAMAFVESAALPSLRALPEPVPAPVITPRQAEALAVRVTALYATADQAYVWNQFNKHFNVAGYRTLPAHRFDEAMAYLTHYLLPSRLAALPLDAPPLEYPVPVKDRKYDRGNPYPRDGETIEMAQEIAIAIRNWAQSQPSSPASKSLAKAADTLYDLLVTGWTEVDEALSAMSRATHYLHRWQGRGGRIGNVG